MDMKKEDDSILQALANTMLDVARESVSLIKRSDPNQALKLTQSQEWEIYLEFLKVMFNLADRISAFHMPIQSQPEFMDSLEDAVGSRLKTLIGPTLSSSEIDGQEIIMSIGNAVAESRQTYERYKFVVSEESKEKEGYFHFAGQQVAAKTGAPNSQAIASSADLCARAVIPAMTALFEGAGKLEESPAAEHDSTPVDPKPAAEVHQKSPVQSIKLVSVVVRVSGEEVETRWGLFPAFRRDLKPEQIKEISKHMDRVNRILGEHFAVLSASIDWEKWQHAGHA